MIKRKLLLILGLMVVAILLLVLIFSVSDIQNKLDNGFNRKYLIQNVIPITFKQINPLVSRISGLTDSSIYFSGQDPSWVIKSDLSFNSFDTLVYRLKKSEAMRDPTTFVDYPHIYMYARDISYLIKGTIDSSHLDTIKLKTPLITRIAQISPQKLVIRGVDSTQARQVFKIIDCISGNVLAENEVFPSQQFGGFEWDGPLRFDKSTQRAYYVPIYQNGIICLDTSLKILFSSHTIDTVLNNQVAIGLVDEGGTTKVMAKRPRKQVNKTIEADNGIVYIVSGLRGDNETTGEFNKIVPIDTYDGENGKYIGSMSLPLLKDLKFRDFKVNKNTLVVLFEDGWCATFDITLLKTGRIESRKN